MRTVQFLTLDSTVLNCDGVFSLLHNMVGDVHAFGVHELANHYGDATDENLIPLFKEHMRLLIWSENRDGLNRFCGLYTALVKNQYVMSAGQRGLDDPIWKTMVAAQLIVMFNNPEIALMVGRFRFVEAIDEAAIRVQGSQLRYNRDFVGSLSQPELRALIKKYAEEARHTHT